MIHRRIRKFGAAGALVVVAAAGALTGVATGATVTIDDAELKGATAIWDLENDYDRGDPCYATEGFQVENGKVGTDSDAFDGGLLLLVDGVTFNIPDGKGNVTMSGHQIAVGPVKMGKLQVTRVERALTSSPTLRSLIGFKNPTNKKVTATVLWDSAMGSDDLERVRASTNGDLYFQAKDSWVVSSDNGNDPDDPVITYVLYGPGAPVRSQKVLNGPGLPLTGPKSNPQACVTVRFKITVPAKSTKYLVFLTEMHATNESAVDQALRFTKIKPTANVFAGLSTQVRKNVLNFKLT